MIHHHPLLVNIFKLLFHELYMIMLILFMRNPKVHVKINLIMMLMLYLDQVIHHLVSVFFILDFIILNKNVLFPWNHFELVSFLFLFEFSFFFFTILLVCRLMLICWMKSRAEPLLVCRDNQSIGKRKINSHSSVNYI